MINPIWPIPAQVNARITQTTFSAQEPGFSLPPYGGFNLACHVGEAPETVAANRQLLSLSLGIGPVQWLEQVHGVEVFRAQYPVQPAPQADAIYTATPMLPIAVLTADCLPVLFCSQAGDEIAVAHAGWRGLAAGVLPQTLKAFKAPPAQLLAYLGPAIGPKHFEVGGEVRQAFIAAFQPYGQPIEPCFTPSLRPGHYWANLYALARLQLTALGVGFIDGGSFCTYTDEHFYSYRRSGGAPSGRMASLMWFDAL
ncbi:MAG: polyphenol oxidase [Pseudomonadota bacterium]|jgi:YfiH family protein